MKKNVFLILFGILFFGINNASATITQIAAPADVSTYVDVAADGDTIQLSTSGGAYTWSAQVMLNDNMKGFTVRAASGLVTRPVVTFSGTTGYFIRLDSYSPVPTSKKLSFDGIEFDGYNTSATYYSSYFYYSNLTFGAYGENIDINNCIFKNFGIRPISYVGITDPFIEANGGDLNITNTVFNNIRAGVIYASATSLYPNPNNINISNCLIVGPSATSSATALISLPKAGFNSYKIDHCTFINSTGSEVSLGLTTSTSYIKNSIFSNNINLSKANTYSVSLGDDCGIYYTSGGAQSSFYPNSSAAKVTDPALDASGCATATEYLTESTDGNPIGYYKTYGLVLSTRPATSITKTSALLNGAILSFDNTSVTSYGFCWNTTGTPTTADSKTDNGTKTTAGNFSNEITNLNGVTTYYVRAYAIDGKRTVYGDIQIVTTLANSYDVTIQVGANGTVSESNASLANGTVLTVNTGETKTFTITPDAGYQITAVTYNGANVYLQISNNQYTTPPVSATGIFAVTFGNNIKTINVTTAGILRSLLSAVDRSIITNLTITGNINARDVKCMRDEMPLLANLDLSGANIEAYNGTLGTSSEPWVTTYLANQMPQSSFSVFGQGKATLTNVKLPNSLTSIDQEAFNNCNNLKNLTIGSLMTSIGDMAFFNCNSVTIIKSLNPTPPTLGSSSFDMVAPTTVYVPIGSVPAYKAAEGWKDFNIEEYRLKATTQSVTSIKLTSAKISGSIDVITDSPVTAHGFCWNTTGTPTIADTKVDNGATTTEGDFSNTVTGLTAATTYYVRAFATDGTSDTVYGDEVSFSTAEIPATSILSGSYYNSQYWPKSKSPYTISGNVNLAMGTTLTIEPGVVINFAGSFEIITMGNVIANGTVIDSITFNANNNLCTFIKFKNAKLSDSELSYLKLEGALQSNYYGTGPGYSYALKTEGILTDSISIYNIELNKSKINSSRKVIIKNSYLNELLAESTKIEIVNSDIKKSDFGGYPGSTDLVIKHSNINSLIISGSSYNSIFNIYDSNIKSSNFGSIHGSLRKSNIYNCGFGYSSGMLIDSTILINPTSNSSFGNCIISNCIFKTDSTQTININGTISKSQFIGDNNKLGGVGLDAVTGTINNSTIVNHRIGLQTSELTIMNSNLINNSKYAIKNTGAKNIDAKNNFWGVGNTTTASVKSMIYDYSKDMNLGTVLYDNFLTIPNTECPLSPPQNVQKTDVLEDVNYTWNANPESDVKGYKLYYGAFNGFTFANSIDVGNVTTYTLSNLSENDIVLVTAYDLLADGKNDMIEGHESWYSAYVFPEKAGTISGSTIVCQGETSKVYTVPAIANASSYIWTLSMGASGTSLTNSITVDFNSSAMSGDITVKGHNDFGDGDISILPLTVNSVPTSNGYGIMGMNTVNQGQNSVSYNINYNNATSYKWTLPDGATGTSTTNNITVNYSTSAVSGNITVTPHNDCGDGAMATLAITVRPLPGAAGAISGSVSVCAGQGSVIYTVPPIENATSYNWTLPDGTYGYSTTNSISVNYYTGATSGNITVKGRNSIGTGVISTLSVTVIQPIGFSGADAISGSKTVCKGETSVIYTTPLVDNATSYVWTLPNGVIGTSTTNSITVDFGESSESGYISVKGINSCFENFGASIPITVIQPIGNADAISGETTVCQGQSSVIYSVAEIDNATSYEWTLPAGATGMSTTNSISVNYEKTAISGDITVKGSNSCGAGAISTLAVTVNPLPAAAGTIVGSTTVCQGESSVIYTVPEIEYATSYIWTLPNGATGISNTNSITVSYENYAVSGSISVKGNNGCGDGLASSIYIMVKPLLGAIGEISKDAIFVCAGGGTANYRISEVENATSYVWTLPQGATGSSNTNYITVDFTETAVTGDITVKAVNDCGETAVVAQKITVMNLSSIGAILGQTAVCAGQKGIIYTVPDVEFAQSYEWSLPNGASGTSTTNSITVDFSKIATSGDITVKAINSCGASEISTLAVIVNPLPVAAKTIVGTSIVCQGENSVTYTVPTIENATTYYWTLPNGVSGSSTTNSITVDYGNMATSGNITVKGQNDCGYGVESVLAITVHQLPVISVENKTVVCGGTIQLNANISNYTENGTLEYLWTPSTGLNDATIANPTATVMNDITYTVTVQTPNSCSTSANVDVKIIAMAKPNLCMVGVNSTNKNIVIWEKLVSSGIESYNIYRETNVTNVYEMIGNVPYSSMSVFVDNSSNPDVQANSYKLSIIDKIGLESEQSNLHRTMHLSINKGLNNTWNLNWEKYEGITVSTYNIYRGTTINNMALIGTTSGNSSQYTDVNPPTGDVYYQLEVINPSPCNPTQASNVSQKVKASDSSVLETYSSSRSNIATNVLSGLDLNNVNSSFKVYPNPIKNELRIEFEGSANYEVVNMVGQVIYNGNLINSTIIQTSNLQSGVYFVKLITGRTFEYKKIIKE